jgi:hypothetical protein
MNIIYQRLAQTDARLGRHVHHDPRSAQYAERLLPRSAIKSVTWDRHTGILDQLNLGSCVPNTGTGLAACDATGYTGVTRVKIPKADTKGFFTAGAVWDLDQDFAVNLYRLVTRIDPYSGAWEPTDTGSDGLSLAKALRMLGLCDTYTHAFSYKAAVSALQNGPVAIGTVWYNSMLDEPKPSGEIVVDPSSGEAGGHEYLSRQFDAENDRIWIDNSWGESWGQDGRAWISGKAMTALLKAQGDVTVPHLVSTAPPEPVPPSDAGDELWAAIKKAAAEQGYA